MSARLYITPDDRRKALLAAMRAANLDRLVIASSGLNHIDQSNPLAAVGPLVEMDADLDALRRAKTFPVPRA